MVLPDGHVPVSRNTDTRVGCRFQTQGPTADFREQATADQNVLFTTSCTGPDLWTKNFVGFIGHGDGPLSDG
jgi:hypothetical protein